MPIIDLQRRMRELGRIRIGRKNDRNQPERLDTFRLTSGSVELLKTAADLYGGTVAEWKDAPGAGKQYELVTDTDSLPVAVPPGQALSQWYEMWSGGGCQRRCDGEREIIEDRACVCSAAGQTQEERDCKPTTRLNVMLPELWDIGVWRLETHGWYAAVELGGIVPLLEAATQSNVALSAQIRLDQRTVKKAGEKYPRHFAVPVIEVEESLGALLSKAGMLNASRPAAPAVAAPAPTAALPQPAVRTDVPDQPDSRMALAKSVAMRMIALGMTDVQRAEFVKWITGGTYDRLSTMAEGEISNVGDVIGQIERGTYTLITDGDLAWAESKPGQGAQVPDAGGSEVTLESLKKAMAEAPGVGQAMLIKKAREIAQAAGVDPNTITSIGSIVQAPDTVQNAIMAWLSSRKEATA